MNDSSTRGVLVLGWLLLALFLPLGLTLEALHALKLPVYLQSPMRREANGFSFFFWLRSTEMR